MQRSLSDLLDAARAARDDSNIVLHFEDEGTYNKPLRSDHFLPDEATSASLDEYLSRMTGSNLESDYQAEVTEIVDKPVAEASFAPPYTLDYFDPSILDRFVRDNYLPDPPTNISRTGDRVAPSTARNPKGDQKLYNREDPNDCFRVRVVYRLVELEGIVDKGCEDPYVATYFDKPYKRNRFIMAYLRLWQSEAHPKYRQFIIHHVSQVVGWKSLLGSSPRVYSADAYRHRVGEVSDSHAAVVVQRSARG